MISAANPLGKEAVFILFKSRELHKFSVNPAAANA
jgi:hypothetical protein